MKNEVDGLIVTVMGKSYEVVKMDRYDETGVRQTKKGEVYTSGEVVDLIVKSALPRVSEGIKEVVFSRREVELEKIYGELIIEPLGQETRLTLRTVPKPIHLPDMDEDATGKTS